MAFGSARHNAIRHGQLIHVFCPTVKSTSQNRKSLWRSRARAGDRGRGAPTGAARRGQLIGRPRGHRRLGATSRMPQGPSARRQVTSRPDDACSASAARPRAGLRLRSLQSQRAVTSLPPTQAIIANLEPRPKTVRVRKIFKGYRTTGVFDWRAEAMTARRLSKRCGAGTLRLGSHLRRGFEIPEG